MTYSSAYAMHGPLRSLGERQYLSCEIRTAVWLSDCFLSSPFFFWGQPISVCPLKLQTPTGLHREAACRCIRAKWLLFFIVQISIVYITDHSVQMQVEVQIFFLGTDEYPCRCVKVNHAHSFLILLFSFLTIYEKDCSFCWEPRCSAISPPCQQPCPHASSCL